MPSTCKTKISEKRTLVDALELCFKQFGSSVAIDAPGCTLTFAELDRITRHVAAEIRTRCSKQQLKSEPIAILMSRSVDFYVAQISVVRAGGFFLPIDPSQPTQRIEFILSDSQAPLLLVRDGASLAVEKPAAVPLPINVRRWMEEHGGREEQSSAARAGAMERWDEVDESDFAYMIYTSGSSGRPKGVPIPHRAVWNLCQWWSEEFQITHGERTLQLMSVGFDASVEEIYPTLITGGTLIPMQPEALNSMEQFLDFVGKQRINKVHFPTALWHALVASFDMQKSLQLPTSVRTVVLGGEKIDPALVESWFSRTDPKVRLINAYGPTEATVAVSYAILRPGDRPSIGTPIRGASFCIVDEDGQLVEAGQSGELYIGGVGIAAGYWRRERLSAEKFVDSPLHDGQPYYRTGDRVRLRSDGNYEFIGRIDDQIKLRGYRIEPGEISNCLMAHPQVRQAHVVARHLSSASTAQQLVGYVVAESNDALSESKLQAFASDRLPTYMIPARIVVMESFPITAGGKLDLKRFPNPAVDLVSDADHDGGSQLLTPTEQKIGKVWEQVLGTSRLGRDANFFKIGGDSLLAMRLVLLLESEFPGPVIPVAALIPNPTIASMADFMDRRQQDSPAAVSGNWPVLTRLSGSQESISVVCIHAAGGGGVFYRQLFEGLDQAAPTAVLESAILYQEGPVVCGRQSVAEMAQDYVDCLIDAGCDQKLTLVGYSFGCLLAFEMARLLKERGYLVDRIINIDSPNPETMKPRNFVSRFWCRTQSPGTFGQRVADFKLVMQRKRRINELQKWERAKLPPPVELRPLALELVFGAIAESYVPEPNDVSMHLISGEYPEAMHHLPDDYGWTEKVSKLTSVQIPGGHNTIFSLPHLRALIAAFQDALAE